MHHSVTAVRQRVPWYSSLRVRLLVVSILVALCSVTATAWLAVTTTTTAIQQQQQGQLLSDDASIYDTLLGYAATHHDWAGAASQVRLLAARTGRRIVLTTQGRQIIASSGPSVTPLPGTASAVVDPLNVTGPMAPAGAGAPEGGIDPRVVGPFLLTSAERTTLAGLAGKLLACLRGDGYGVTLSTGPSGRPAFALTGNSPKPYWYLDCGVLSFDKPMPSEKRALGQLNRLVDGCLSRQHLSSVTLNVDESGITWNAGFHPVGDGAAVQSCLDASRREQLRPYAAPACPAVHRRPRRPGPWFRNADVRRPQGIPRIGSLTSANRGQVSQARPGHGSALLGHASAISSLVATPPKHCSIVRSTFTAVMGPSGSGKSTFLHCAAGLDRPTSGRVWLGEEELAGKKEAALTVFRREHVGFVFQAYNLLGWLTVEENIALPLRLAGRTVDRDLVREVAGVVELGVRMDQRPSQLSGGQQQRVALARALVTRPEVVFLDEPTGALDTRTARQVLQMLRQAVKRTGQTTVMVTHDPVAASFADSVVFLADGRIAGSMTAPSPAQIAERMTSLGEW